MLTYTRNTTTTTNTTIWETLILEYSADGEVVYFAEVYTDVTKAPIARIRKELSEGEMKLIYGTDEPIEFVRTIKEQGYTLDS